jgi:hypothetical protein
VASPDSQQSGRKQQIGEKIVSSINSVGKCACSHVLKIDPIPHCTKINSNWTEDLTVGCETLQLPEGNLGKTLQD